MQMQWINNVCVTFIESDFISKRYANCILNVPHHKI